MCRIEFAATQPCAQYVNTMSEGEYEGNKRVLKELEHRAAEAERRLRTLEQGNLICSTGFAQQRALVIHHQV